MKAIRHAPETLITNILNQLIKDKAKLFWQTIKYVARLNRKGTIATSFNKDSLAKEGLDPEYDLADYFAHLYMDQDATAEILNDPRNGEEHPSPLGFCDSLSRD